MAEKEDGGRSTAAGPQWILEFVRFVPVVAQVAGYVQDGRFARGRYRQFIVDMDEAGFPVGFMRVVEEASSYRFRPGGGDRVETTFNTIHLDRETLESARWAELNGRLTEVVGVHTIYHESTHAFLDVARHDPEVEAFLAAGRRHYVGAPTGNSTYKTTTDPDRVLQEAAAGYVAHRVATAWMIEERLRSTRDGGDLTLELLEELRGEYDQQMALDVFGYSDEGGHPCLFGVGARETATTRAMTGEMKDFLDTHVLEGGIPHRFEERIDYQLLVREAKEASARAGPHREPPGMMRQGGR